MQKWEGFQNVVVIFISGHETCFKKPVLDVQVSVISKSKKYVF